MEDIGAPESWEVADLDESMSRLMLSSKKDSKPPNELNDDSAPALASSPAFNLGSGSAGGDDCENMPDDVIDQVDQFLREALQNPRERLSSKPYVGFLIRIWIRLCTYPRM